MCFAIQRSLPVEDLDDGMPTCRNSIPLIALTKPGNTELAPPKLWGN
jgi:hypothetical protein